MCVEYGILLHLKLESYLDDVVCMYNDGLFSAGTTLVSLIRELIHEMSCRNLIINE